MHSREELAPSNSARCGHAGAERDAADDYAGTLTAIGISLPSPRPALPS